MGQGPGELQSGRDAVDLALLPGAITPMAQACLPVALELEAE
jgi:hypothetical protein